MATGSASAQSAEGGLRGVVKDPQGVIPGVTVTLTNEANNVSRETVTNEVGEYSFPAVDPGTYTVKAGVSGYKTFERKGVRISTQQLVGLDVTLEVGQLEETITVTADAPLIETTNASTGDVTDAKVIESIPASRLNSVGVKLASYFPAADARTARTALQPDQHQPHADGAVHAEVSVLIERWMPGAGVQVLDAPCAPHPAPSRIAA